MSKKCPKNSKFLVSEYTKVLKFNKKKPKTFLNKSTKNNKNYMEVLNSKSKYINDGSP